MISWFKKHFIPHIGNEHRPHFLRKENIRNVVIVVLFLEVFTFLIPTLTRINSTGGMAAVLPAVLADLTNDERQAQNLSTLTTNPLLVQAAEMKANDMATKGYFAHTSPEGKTPWYWLDQVGYKYQYAGENLAINFSDSKDVTEAWMNSPTHRANIMKDKYTDVGTGIATGIYQGKETVFVAQVYANPLVVETTETNVKKETTPIATVIPKVEKTTETTNVLGAEVTAPSQIEKPALATPAIPKISFLQKAFASPRNTNKVILSIIFGIIVIALILYIFIKKRNHHVDLITNGLIVLVIIGAIFSVNYYLSHRRMVVYQSLDYSNQNK